MKTITKQQHKKILGSENEYENDVEQIIHRLFNEIPSEIQLDISESKQNKYLDILKEKFDLKLISRRENRSSRKREKDSEVLVDIKNGIVIKSRSHDYMFIYYCSIKTPSGVIDKYINLAKEYYAQEKKKPKRNRIFIFTIKGQGMKQQYVFFPFKLDKFDIDISANYNEDFQPKYTEIKKRFNKKDDNGILILYGEPGTGKSYFLKHLCKVVKKKILYVPPALVQYIVEPFFIKLLGKHKNSILIIEDADNIMKKRDINSNMQEVSSLLNISDGILHDVLKLQIVVTFNTDLSRIDEAFLRKGRLIAEHRFDKLAANKAQLLSKKLGYNTKIEEPMTLADIYNQSGPEMTEKKPAKKIGFKSNNMQPELAN